MTLKQAKYRKQLLQKIHLNHNYIHLFELGIWQEFLISHYNVTSSKFLSINELIELLNILRGNLVKTEQTEDLRGRDIIQPSITEKQIFKIKALQGEKSNSWLFHFIKHQTGELYCSLNVLSKKQATKVILGLEKVIQNERLKNA